MLLSQLCDSYNLKVLMLPSQLCDSYNHKVLMLHLQLYDSVWFVECDLMSSSKYFMHIQDKSNEWWWMNPALY